MQEAFPQGLVVERKPHGGAGFPASRRPGEDLVVASAPSDLQLDVYAATSLLTTAHEAG
ncbi:MAG: hypothetical protein ACRDYX_21965 [Egibacteraceae bacterium]